MNYRQLSRVVVAGILVAAVALAAPVQARAAGTHGPASFWEWVAGLRTWGLSVLAPGRGPAQEVRTGNGLKAVSLGEPGADTGSDSSTPAGAGGPGGPGDQGPGIDPNG